MKHLDRIRNLDCLICEHMGMDQKGLHSEAHHLESIRDRFSDYAAIPLCVEHHRGSTGVHGLSRRSFFDRYKLSDVDLLARTIKALFK